MPSAAGAAPAQVQFNLQDGNTTVGFRYDPPHARHGGPLLIMIHGASDTHTVFDFFPGFQAAPELARWACRCWRSTASATAPAATPTAIR